MHYLLLLFGVFPTQWARSLPPQDIDNAEPGLHACMGSFQVVAVLIGLSFFLCSDNRAMGFPDSSCLLFDFIFSAYLLSYSSVSCWGRDMPLVPHQRDLGGWLFPRGSWRFFICHSTSCMQDFVP